MVSFDAMVMRMTARVNCLEPGEVRVEAPPFHVWSEGLHELVCTDRRDAVARMTGGFVVCEDPDCDWCRDVGQEPSSDAPQPPAPRTAQSGRAPRVRTQYAR